MFNVYTAKVHNLKILPKFYESQLRGEKPWEIRYNGDRDFHKDEILVLHEWDNGYTGREICKVVTAVFDVPEYLNDGYVVLSLRCMTQEEFYDFKGYEKS